MSNTGIDLLIKSAIMSCTLDGNDTLSSDELCDLQVKYDKIRSILSEEFASKFDDLIQASCSAGYKYAKTTCNTNNVKTDKDEIWDKIIYRMSSSGVESDKIAEYLGISEDMVEKSINKNF